MSKGKVGNQKQGRGAVQGSRPKAPAKAAFVPDGISLFLEKYAFSIATGLIVLLAFIVYKDFLLFNKVFLFKDIGSDTVNIAYPPMRHIADYISTLGLPKWSFNYGMGQNIFPFFLQRDPFSVFLFMLGKDHFVYCIGYIEFVKVVAGGLVFFFYLRTLSLNAFVCIVGSLLYSFSGFMILGSCWYVFSFEAFAVALLLLSFERFFKSGSWWLFTVPVFLICITMPFNLYVYGLFLAVYAAFRFIDEKEWSLKAFSGMYLKLIGYGLLGVGLGAVCLFSNVLQLFESPRGSGDTSYFAVLSSQQLFGTGTALQYISSLMRFFSSDLMGTGNAFKGWQNYLEAPILYCGLLTMLLFPAVFQYLSRKKRIIYALFLGFWVLPLLFPYFRYAFWLFTGDYYRAFSFLVALTVLYLALQALQQLITTSKVSLIWLAATLLLLLIVLSIDFSKYEGMSSSSINKSTLLLVRIFLIIYAVLIYLLSMPAAAGMTRILLLVLLCVELGSFSHTTVNKRILITKQEFERREGYNDYSVEAIAYLKQQDKSFYRVDKDYSSGPAMHASINDGLAQDYKGTSSYNSFNQQYYIRFLQAIGLSQKGNETEARWAGGLARQPLVETIGSVKYFLDKQGYNSPNYDSLAQFGDVRVLKSKYYLPLGFTYDKCMLRSEFDKLSSPQRALALLKIFFIDDKEKDDYKDFALMTSGDTLANYTYDNYAADVDTLRRDTLAISDFGQNFIKGKIDLDKRKLLFLSIPFDKGWTARVDGKVQETKIVDAGMTGLLLEKGVHTIELEFYPPLLKEGLIVSVISLLALGVLIYLQGKRRPTV